MKGGEENEAKGKDRKGKVRKKGTIFTALQRAVCVSCIISVSPCM